MDKVGNFIGRTVFGILSIAATAIVSVLVQRYMETVTNTPTPFLQPEPASAPAEPIEAAPIVPEIAPTEIIPTEIESAPVEPIPAAIDTQPPGQFAEEVPNPLDAETRIDPANPSVPSTEANDAPVQILFEEEQNPGNSSNHDSDIMQTFWDKLKNK